MTVKKLIEQLSKLNPELDIIIQGTDPTDWTYYNDVVGKVREQNVYLSENDKKKTKVVIIDGGCF
jgi:hypothetical protein